MTLNAPTLFWLVVTFLLGITIGSFLNAVIYRLPNGLSLLEPRHSICPICRKNLSAIDLVPLLSFLFLGAKCRQCKAPIPWRYFYIELLTGALFVAVTLRFYHDLPTCIAMLLFTAVMVPIFFIDLDTFQIPTSLNLLATFIPLGRDVWGIAHHEAGHELVWGWLPISLFGGAVGILIFGSFRVLGWVWMRVEAMGLGDVVLARGMGGMLACLAPSMFTPLRLLPIWVMLSVLSGAVLGLILKFAEKRAEAKISVPVSSVADAVLSNDGTGNESSLGRELLDVGWCMWFGDLFEYLMSTFGRRHDPEGVPEKVVEDEWVPAASAIPFGPYLVVGFFVAAFCGELLTAAYLANYVLPKTLPVP